MFMKWGMIFASGLLIGLLIYHLLFAPVETVFSPDEGHEIIELFDSAEKSIDIEMYVFTSRDVVESLERAKSRGVKIRIIIERSTISGSNNQIYQELAAKGFNVRYASDDYKLTHSKFSIIDGKAVLVGSHNFSNSALYKNREASVILHDMETINEFMSIFETDWAIAT
jgi:phosphatidylserine/phosphatidylglycerophosphate/cardiolipin synthase-like enzyme